MRKSNSIPPSVRGELLDAASRRNPKPPVSRLLAKYRGKPWHSRLLWMAKVLLYLKSSKGRSAFKALR